MKFICDQTQTVIQLHSVVVPKAFTSLANIPQKAQMQTPPGGYEKPGYEADSEASQKLLRELQRSPTVQ